MKRRKICATGGQWRRKPSKDRVRESLQALSLATSEKTVEIERAKVEVVEAFKASNAFTLALVECRGKALEDSQRAIGDDLKRLYPSVDPTRVPTSNTC